MFADRKDKDEAVKRVLDELASHHASMVHDKHYDYIDCLNLGLSVTSLESDQELQDKVLTIHHLYVLSSYKLPQSIKFIESDRGMIFTVSGKK